MSVLCNVILSVGRGRLNRCAGHAGELENKTANTLAWAPKGRFIALATCGSSVKYDIEFWDLDFTIDDTVNKRDTPDPGNNMQHLATGEHFGMTDVAWDPLGRYLASSASAFRQSVSRRYEGAYDWKSGC